MNKMQRSKLEKDDLPDELPKSLVANKDCVALVIESQRQSSIEFQLSILCFDLSKVSAYTQFLLCSFGVFFFYLIYGFLQELIFTMEGFKPFGWYLTMIQFFLYSIFGFVEIRLKGEGPRKMPLKNYLLLSILTVGTMGFSNASLGYLNYPTQVIFKCCKLIPVLIGGIMIQDKTFSIFDWLACLCMSCGLVFFTLADTMVAPNFNFYGLVFINIALCFDAALGNLQEKLMKKTQASNAEVVLYSYALGFFYILLGQLISSQLFDGFLFCLKNPRVYVYTLLFSFSGYLGVNIVLSLVQMYGALIAVTVTTLRKAVTIILSFIIFSKPFTIQYLWSGLIVLLGIYLNIYSKNRKMWGLKVASLFKKISIHFKPKIVSLQTLKANIV